MLNARRVLRSPASTVARVSISLPPNLSRNSESVANRTNRTRLRATPVSHKQCRHQCNHFDCHPSSSSTKLVDPISPLNLAGHDFDFCVRSSRKRSCPMMGRLRIRCGCSSVTSSWTLLRSRVWTFPSKEETFFCTYFQWKFPFLMESLH